MRAAPGTSEPPLSLTMPQLDRVLPRLESGAASQVILEAGNPIRCMTATGLQLVTQQVLTRDQVIALVAEVASPAERERLTGAQSVRVMYAWNGQQYLVDQDTGSETLKLRIRKWVEGAMRATDLPLVSLTTESSVTNAGSEVDEPMTFTVANETMNSTAPRESSIASNGAAASAPEVAPFGAPNDTSPTVVSGLRRRSEDRPFGSFENEEAARRAMEAMLRMQVERGAADLHLRCGEPPILRLGSDLVRVEDVPALEPETISGMMWSIMPEKSRGEYTELMDTDFAYEIADLSRFRVNVLRDRYGMAVVIRTIANGTVTVEQMGISLEVQELCKLTKGLVLVTGPTGSGKSTTLCAMVDLINRTRSDHIITIEDPIEFVHKSKKCLITQRQVGVHTQSFRSALRAALREDPDIILVGELRDLETIAIAMETAETGHLVFGTLHTSTAASTINRIVDQFPADRQEQIRIMLAESLRGVVSQTLCKKIGGGRVAAREILLVNKAVSALIREGKTVQIPNIIQTQRKLGMETLNDALMSLVKSHTIEPEEAYVRAVERKDMLLKLRAAGHSFVVAGSDE